MLVIDSVLYAFCILRELIVRILQFFIGDPLSRINGPYWFYAPYPESVKSLPVCIITGGTHGIGWETAINLARNGIIRVIITSREIKNLEATKAEFKALTGNPNVEVLPLDLSSFGSIKAFAGLIQERDLPVNILIHNAGVLPDKARKISEDGFELSWQVNYLGPFYLNRLLMPNLKRANPPARIIAVSSVAHVFGNVDMTDLAYLRREFHFSRAYADAKLALLLFSHELQRRMEKEGHKEMLSVAVHPGLVASKFYDTYISKHWLLGFKSPKSGARTQTYMAVAPSPQIKKGGYYAECLPSLQSFQAADHVIAELLWDETEKLINNKLAHK